MTIMPKNEFKTAGIIIVIFVVIFNIEAVFGLRTLLEDDFARYLDAVNGLIFRRFPVLFPVKALNKYLMLISMPVARLFYVLFFAIPLSVCVYYLNRIYFKFEFFPALFTAILINILPFQTQIPAFLDGNYPLIGLIFFFLAVIAALDYLKSPKLSMLLAASSLWYLSNYQYTLAELNISILPSVLLLIVFYEEGLTKTKVNLLVIFAAIPSYKIYELLTALAAGKSRAAGTAVTLPAEDMLARFTNLVSWSSLLPMRWFQTAQQQIIVTALIFVCVLVAGVSILIVQKNQPQRAKHLKAVIFYSLFSLLAVLPFMTASPFLAPRHFYVAQVGIYSLFILCLFLLLTGLFRSARNAGTISCLVLLAITLFAGIHRHQNLADLNTQKNSKFDFLCTQLKQFGEIRPGSQIVVTGYEAGTGEHFVWSSGLYSFCLKTPGIIGILGNEYSFYDPFQLADRKYFRKMGGLDTAKPTYILRGENSAFVRPRYLLRWHDKGKSDSLWTIYAIDKSSNLLKELTSGKGISAYSASLKKEGLSPKEILWGGLDPAREWTRI